MYFITIFLCRGYLIRLQMNTKYVQCMERIGNANIRKSLVKDLPQV